MTAALDRLGLRPCTTPPPSLARRRGGRARPGRRRLGTRSPRRAGRRRREPVARLRARARCLRGLDRPRRPVPTPGTASSRRASPAPSSPTRSRTSRRARWAGSRPGRRLALVAPVDGFVATCRDPGFVASLAETPGRDAPRRGLHARRRDLPPVRRGAGAPARRARAPDQRRHPRGADRRPRRARGLGLSVPEEYGGFATGGENDYLGMVVATEELTWGSLGIGGSLITRPEILTRAFVNGGTPSSGPAGSRGSRRARSSPRSR